MTVAKIALSVQADVLKLAKKEVKAGRAKSLSSFVSEAVEEKLRRDELTKLLDAMDVAYGKPDQEAQRWAKRVLQR
jgi:hypothetical protein